MSELKKLQSYFKGRVERSDAKDNALKNKIGPSYKRYEGKVKTDIPGESTEDRIKRVNHHVAMSSSIEKSRTRHARRHNKGERTSLSERKKFINEMSKE